MASESVSSNVGGAEAADANGQSDSHLAPHEFTVPSSSEPVSKIALMKGAAFGAVAILSGGGVVYGALRSRPLVILPCFGLCVIATVASTYEYCT
uniref:Transmembrane protein n=1 Tax=Ditylenchus dipsaci TaxID=166011 RepID=A0A915CXX5_9BILA